MTDQVFAVGASFTPAYDPSYTPGYTPSYCIHTHKPDPQAEIAHHLNNFGHRQRQISGPTGILMLFVFVLLFPLQVGPGGRGCLMLVGLHANACLGTVGLKAASPSFALLRRRATSREHQG